MKPELKETKDGSFTLYNNELDEYYHSHFGAITESRHVYIDAGLKHSAKVDLNILEIGFGTGLNAILTLLEIRDSSQEVHYTGLEKHPVDSDLLQSLCEKSSFSSEDKKLFDQIHQAPWNDTTNITDYFSLEKIEGDIRAIDFHSKYNLVYFDAFGPDKQPDLWSTGIFSNLFNSMHPISILTTFSTKGQIRRNMKAAGFRVEKLPGPPGKFDMTRAFKD